MPSIPRLSLAQQISLTIIPAVAGALSVLGSSSIIWTIAKDWKLKTANIKNRFLLGLCLSNLVNSLWFIVWSLPIPAGSPDVWGAIGNNTTCQIQGFWLQMGCAGSFYNGALSLYFLMSLRYSLSDSEISRRYEAWCHIIAIMWPLCTAVTAASLNLFTVTGLGCWMSPQPPYCQLKSTDYECTEHKHAYIYSWMFTGVPLVILILFISFCMFQIYMAVREITNKAQSHIFRGVENQERNHEENSTDDFPSVTTSGSPSASNLSARLKERKKETAYQAFLYVAAFALTHGFAISKSLYLLLHNSPQCAI